MILIPPPAVYIDTGLEYPEIREFVKTKENVIWLKPKMNFRNVIKSYGYPLISKDVSSTLEQAIRKPDGYKMQRFTKGSKYHQKYGDRWMLFRWSFLLDAPFKVSDRCCYIMKKNPAKKYEKETGRVPILATMACESDLRKTHWLKNACNTFDGKRATSQPLSFWTEQDILEYIVKYNLAYAPVYGEILKDDKGKYHTTGCQRTGCVFCGFGCHLEKSPNRFQRLKITHPKLWNYCMKPWEDGGLGMREVLEYIGVDVQ